METVPDGAKEPEVKIQQQDEGKRPINIKKASKPLNGDASSSNGTASQNYSFLEQAKGVGAGAAEAAEKLKVIGVGAAVQVNAIGVGAAENVKAIGKGAFNLLPNNIKGYFGKKNDRKEPRAVKPQHWKEEEEMRQKRIRQEKEEENRRQRDLAEEKRKQEKIRQEKEEEERRKRASENNSVGDRRNLNGGRNHRKFVERHIHSNKCICASTRSRTTKYIHASTTNRRNKYINAYTRNLATKYVNAHTGNLATKYIYAKPIFITKRKHDQLKIKGRTADLIIQVMVVE
ncbi:hypothetical protein YC2023_123113 [Brassica napus]